MPGNLKDESVLPALVLDLRHHHRADLGGAADMGAAAGLEVDPGDLHQAHAAHAARRLDRHRAHELGFDGELLVGDPARPDRVTLGDQRVEPARDLFLVEARSGDVKIEPPPAIRYLTPCHGTRNDAAQ